MIKVALQNILYFSNIFTILFLHIFYQNIVSSDKNCSEEIENDALDLKYYVLLLFVALTSIIHIIQAASVIYHKNAIYHNSK